MNEVETRVTDLDSRQARLEGVIEQVNERLNSIDRRLDGQQQWLRWIVGIQITSFVTLGSLTMTVVLKLFS
ncbi:MAG: hypothetical protein J4F39_13175 [Candidatus Latescibacteria bacterium]|nr:hypothetical protein [Candidatus Latescibacterota bacterium]